MAKFAEGTTTKVATSQIEIQKTLNKYKAAAFSFAERDNRAYIEFIIQSRRIRFAFDLPVKGKFKTAKGWLAGQPHIDAETRRLWRCIVWSIKTKLDCVASGITTLDQEFMPYIVMPNGRTVAEAMLPEIEAAYNGPSQPLLDYKR